jgi:hypothetical protein
VWLSFPGRRGVSRQIRLRRGSTVPFGVVVKGLKKKALNQSVQAAVIEFDDVQITRIMYFTVQLTAS